MLAVGDMNKVLEATELGLKDEIVESLRPIKMSCCQFGRTLS